MQRKTPTLVIYDIHSTKVRTKMAEACLDLGLERIQLSAFQGMLNNQQRNELFKKLRDLMVDTQGRLFILPVCSDDWASAMVIEQGEIHGFAPHKPTEETILRF